MNDWLTVHIGDNRVVLDTLPDASVHCVVTSPPYWGLRDYGTATWDGGSEDCDHLRPVQRRNERPKGAFHGGTDDGDYAREPQYKDTCRSCGAVRVDSQLGLEATPEEYVASMVDVFRKVRRVLRDDGTVWLNLGDTFMSSGGERAYGSSDNGTGRGPGTRRHDVPRSGLKPKDLVGIPWRVAFALQADGWYLRSDIIWAKPNPMPESVTDRPTKSHEYLFLLTKSARYYFDQEAVREPFSGVPYEGRDNGAILNGDRKDRGRTIGMTPRPATSAPSGPSPPSPTPVLTSPSSRPRWWNRASRLARRSAASAGSVGHRGSVR